MEEKCCICGEDLNGKTSVLGEKGCKTINRVDSSLVVRPGLSVQHKCRLDLTRRPNNNSSKTTDNEDSSRGVIRRRSMEQQYIPGDHCFFCGEHSKYDNKTKLLDVIPVRTIEFQESISQKCQERGDEWAQKVFGRLQYLLDLHAADAVYHKSCDSSFRTNRNIPMKFLNPTEDKSNKKMKLSHGRPVNNVKNEAFVKVIDYLENNEDEQLTVADLVERMNEYLEGTEEEPYSLVYMKKKIQEHFGDRVLISTTKSKANVVTFHHNVASIVHEFYLQPRNDDPEAERLRIISTAAKLIKNEVMAVEDEGGTYPTSKEMSSADEGLKFLPSLLKYFLEILCSGKDIKLKVASLGQALMQAMRPRSLLAPIQLGLGVQMHHHFASRFLIDTLNSHGFSASYYTVQKYERSAAVTQRTEIPGWIPGSFGQFVADNVDHNTRTIDGEGTFHGMGIIATITPGTNTNMLIPKREVTATEISKAGQIIIRPYIGPPEDTSNLCFKKLRDLKVTDSTANLDLLWKLTLPLLRSPRPGWAGTMQNAFHGEHPGKSSIMFLPMIDMDPGNMTCINSTLLFICQQASRYGITPIVTFDQPLWWKALLLINDASEGSVLKSIVLRLGGLHTEMSYLGAIGHIMAGSGLEELLELVYAKNAVIHMLSGKAIARAIRGHMLVDQALNTIIACNALNIPLPIENNESQAEENLDEPQEGYETSDKLLETDLDLLRQFCEKPSKVLLTSNEVTSVLEKTAKKLDKTKKSMADQRTSVLWMEYMKMIDILKRFIKAERTGDWKLHLQAVHDMRPYFAASGHNQYAKSAHIYLQMMHDLENTHPDVYKSFMSGHHVVRRSDRLWAGLSTDLVIEQALMRSLKTSGGLTRGRGMTETQRLVWVMSMPACASINEAMQSLTESEFNTSDQHIASDQHKECTKSRMIRDHSDVKKILEYLSQRNPFENDASLRSIANGVVADKEVNCDKAKVVGEAILKNMEGKNVEEYSFTKADQVTTFASKTSVKVGNKQFQIDPQLLFQRLSVLATSGQFDNPESMFKFEMSSYPTSLFDSCLLPRQANKPALADAIWAETQPAVPTTVPKGAKYVLDGGALIHRIQWARGATYSDICLSYVQYVQRKYGVSTIVFDGYEDGPTTKDCTHQRRSKSVTPPVKFDPEMIVALKKNEFLSNTFNKQRFIRLLGEKLEDAGCLVLNASGDADLLIVKRAVESARTHNTVLVGDDTDLLVLLLFHGKLNEAELFFKPEPKRTSKSKRIWNVKQTKQALGETITSNILFVHALLGCDTTSRIHGIGKGASFKKIKTSTFFQEQARIFQSDVHTLTKEDIVAAGEKALVSLYNGGKNDSLDTLRFKFCQKVSTGSAFVQPENLPPTSTAARFHSLRVYQQVQQWRGIELKPEEWGWELKDEHLVPIRTTQPAAHSSLLEMIRCGCKGDCGTQRCSCRKNGLDCSAACSVCRGVSCTNSPVPDLNDGTDEDGA